MRKTRNFRERKRDSSWVSRVGESRLPPRSGGSERNVATVVSVGVFWGLKAVTAGVSCPVKAEAQSHVSGTDRYNILQVERERERIE